MPVKTIARALLPATLFDEQEVETVVEELKVTNGDLKRIQNYYAATNRQHLSIRINSVGQLVVTNPLKGTEIALSETALMRLGQNVVAREEEIYAAAEMEAV